MSSLFRGPRRRRGGTNRTALLYLLLYLLLMTTTFIGCQQKESTSENETLDQPPAHGVPLSEETSPTQTSTVGEAASETPKIRFNEPHHDFGEAQAGEDVEHTFTFENVGGAVLTVTKVRTSCGCTAALISEKEIPPGGTGEIKTTFLTKGYQGEVKKSLTVESNDPEHELVRLTIGGKVLSEVTVWPRYLNWGSIIQGDLPRPKRMTIWFTEGRGLRLEKIQSESPSVVLKKESEQEDKVIYSVALAENLPAGRFTGRITVRTNSERLPEVHVPFYGFVEGNVKVVPHLISVGTMAPGEDATRTLSLKKTGDQDFSIREIKTTTEEITTEIIEKKKGSRYRIKVTYKPRSQTVGRIAERITIFMNDGEQDFLEVPLYGKVGEGAEKSGG